MSKPNRCRVHLYAVSVACALLASASLAQGGTGSAGDGEVFAAVVRSLAERAEGTLRVDLRPLQPGADLTSIDPADLAPAAREREPVLHRLGVVATDVLLDERCLFAAGLPHPPGAVIEPDSIRARREQCRAQPAFTSVAVGLPRRAAAGSGAELVVSVARLTRGNFSVLDLYLRRSGAGGWEVAKSEERLSVWS